MNENEEIARRLITKYWHLFALYFLSLVALMGIAFSFLTREGYGGISSFIASSIFTYVVSKGLRSILAGYILKREEDLIFNDEEPEDEEDDLEDIEYGFNIVEVSKSIACRFKDVEVPSWIGVEGEDGIHKFHFDGVLHDSDTTQPMFITEHSILVSPGIIYTQTVEQ